MKFSIVIPTYNRIKYLKSCLESIQLQTMEKELFEVIVIDDGSSDGTKDSLELFKTKTRINFQYLRQDNKGPAAARNLGIKTATGEFVAFLDDDCVPSAEWLEELLHDFPKDSRCAGMGGMVEPSDNSIISKFMTKHKMLLPKVIDDDIRYLVTANAIFRRSCLLEVEGFDTFFSIPAGEDTDLSIRLKEKGYYLHWTGKAIVKHMHRDTFSGLYKTYFTYGRGRYLIYLKGKLHPVKKYRFLLPFVLFIILTLPLSYLFKKEERFTDRLAFILLESISKFAYCRGYQYQRKITNRKGNLS